MRVQDEQGRVYELRVDREEEGVVLIIDDGVGETAFFLDGCEEQLRDALTALLSLW